MQVKEFLEKVDILKLKRAKKITICRPDKMLLTIRPVAAKTTYNSGDRCLYIKIKNGEITLNIETIETIEEYENHKEDGICFNMLLK
jgi:hypothetical protein